MHVTVKAQGRYNQLQPAKTRKV